MIDILIEALEIEKNGDWNKAHRIVQDINTPEAAHIHAFLHRKEGDLFNANYWYSQAGRKMPNMTFEDEWQSIYTELRSKL